MSASFEIKSSLGNYSVYIESHGFEGFLKRFDSSFVIADSFFKPRLSRSGQPAIFVEASETTKSLDAAPALIEQLRRSGAGRQTHLIAVGGGVLQDVSAFVASIYMRGLKWSYIPTTVLAMADSCIGGKSSINVGQYKNLVGTFHPPVDVLIDPALSVSLAEHDRAGGLVEAAKICFCRGAEWFDRYLSSHPGPAMPIEDLEKVVTESLLAKKWFIEIDEFDKKERLLLNFGHTFGHAIEGATHFGIPHGIAVGLGILCALEFERHSGFSYALLPRVAQLEQHLDALIRTAPGLVGHLEEVELDDFIARFESDKKHTSDQFNLILVDAAGVVVLKKIPRTTDSRAHIRSAVTNVVKRYVC